MMKLDKDVLNYLNNLEPKRKKDMEILMDLIHQITGYNPVLVGSILYYGSLTYRYKTGRKEKCNWWVFLVENKPLHFICLMISINTKIYQN